MILYLCEGFSHFYVKLVQSLNLTIYLKGLHNARKDYLQNIFIFYCFFFCHQTKLLSFNTDRVALEITRQSGERKFQKIL